VDRKPSASSIFVLTEPNKGCVKEIPDLPYPLFATPVWENPQLLHVSQASPIIGIPASFSKEVMIYD